MRQQLLTRDQFRSQVFQRDRNVCVVCKAPAQDAHHIIERRLWKDGGYYLDNGASLCGLCHLLAERTAISVEEIREKAGITKPIIPEHLYSDVRYDKWANVILPNGQRLKGELFDDPSVRKVLELDLSVWHSFTDYVKYPRTYHLPWSPGVSKDDRVMEDLSVFEGKQIVMTEKMDGENTTMYDGYIHARSVESGHHPSRAWVKQLHAKIGHNIDDGWRICGENLYAKHSIQYEDLDSYFLVFSIWNENNVCLSWEDTLLYSKVLDLHTVPLIYSGEWNPDRVTSAFEAYKKNQEREVEGYVVRLASEFHYSQFRHSVAKYVRKNHIQTHGHWMREQMVLNRTKEYVNTTRSN